MTSPVDVRRLLAAPSGTGISVESYRGFHAALDRGPEWVWAEIEASGLRGRGGAGFSTAHKWAAVAQSEPPRYIVANGEEGEVASWKDRYLMRRHPHLVIEGVALSAFAVGSNEAWIYLADPVAARILETALCRVKALVEPVVTIQIVTVPHSYIAGEESAAIRFINGGPAMPTSKPPRPYEAGLRGRPTLVNNVETLAHAAWIAGNSSSSFRSAGTQDCPGTFLACVSGAVASPILLEVPFGVTLREIVSVAHPTEEVRHVMLGGYFSGMLPSSALDMPADYDVLRSVGVGLGNGAIIVLGSACPVRVLGDLLAFFAQESSGQCLACAGGTVAMRDILARLRSGEASLDDLGRLEHYGESLVGRGACQLLDAAAATSRRAMGPFRASLEMHLTESCSECREAGPPDPSGGFAVDFDALSETYKSVRN